MRFCYAIKTDEVFDTHNGVGDDAAYIARTIAGDVRSSVPVAGRVGAAPRAASA
jgi:hypothetical protein